MANGTTATIEDLGVFTRDGVEILATRKVEPEWLRAARLRAHEVYVDAPMPTTREEEWRYTDIGELLKLDALQFAEEARPLGIDDELPQPLRDTMHAGEPGAARIVQQDASVVLQTLPEELRAQGVIFCSLEQAAREHEDLVLRYLGRAVENTDNKFAALNAAYWTGGVFLYVPKNVQVEEPFRTFRWISQGGSTAFGRTLFVAEEGAKASLVDTMLSPDFVRQTLSVGAAEVYGGEGAQINYVAAQRLGNHAVHLHTDRLIAGRDARVTTLYVALGGAVTRGDVQCRLRESGSHVDMLGLYIADGEQHFDHQTLQDHISPHASSNLLFKGALTDMGRSVFRGLIRVHPKAQRTDAYQTNRNLILSNQARADSLPNLEIQADDVRCSHAATVGQLDEEELFYLLSRGIPKAESIRLVVFGFFSEVLDQLPEELNGVKREMMRVIERKLAGSSR